MWAQVESIAIYGRASLLSAGPPSREDNILQSSELATLLSGA